ncbi:hypothetical protein INR49_009257 [Caranx melampygus]|nr:hypothetical protein INR49_009257 [Caranx melampygus]
MVKDAFWDYVAKATRTAEDSLRQIRESELGTDLNSLISRSTDAVNKFTDTLQTQVAPATVDLMSKLTQEAERLKARLEKDLTEAGGNAQPYAQDLLVQPPEAGPGPEALKAVLLQKSQELQENLAPYGEELKEQLDADTKVSPAPSSDDITTPEEHKYRATERGDTHRRQTGVAVMRVFAVVLVLAVLSGCQARSLPQGPVWEEALDQVQGFLSELKTKTEELMRDVRSSQVGRELERLHSVWAATCSRGDKLQERVGVVREQVEKYSQELQTMMEQNVDDVRVRVSTYTRKMKKKRLNKDTEEIKRHVADYMEELQSRTSENVEELRTRLDPYFSQVDSVKDMIQNTAADVRSTLEEKMEEVHRWFQPYIAMVSDNL